ncbi:hypothetical protein AGMMS49975_05100 [Clostridia bacterium]|nr:hypothetical protein AGMMS49975_05100 [Clostridia bacterium]
MGGFTSLATATSGLTAAQTGLYVTGHNMANVDTIGFSRQRPLMQDFASQNVGAQGAGPLVKQVGLGTDVAGIFQIRDKFLDIAYREEAGKLEYYNVRAMAGVEVESILGELQSQYNTDSVFKDLFASLQELSFDAQSLATRANFISTAVTFVDKVTNVYQRTVEYQHNLDKQVRDTVTRINQLLNDIDRYNRLIPDAEAAEDHANDFRDSRNNCLDELSHLLDIDYKEMTDGTVTVMAEGNELVSNGYVNQLGLRYTTSTYSFVEPVFTRREDIMSSGEFARTVFDYSLPINPANRNDSGKLKSLIVTRGLYPLNYADEVPPKPTPTGNPTVDKAAMNEWQKIRFNNEDTLIPTFQKEFDIIVNKVVTMINDCVAPQKGGFKDPDAPYDLEADPVTGAYINTRGTEIFSRLYQDRWGDPFDPTDNENPGAAYNPETPGQYYSLYTSGNLKVNPVLLAEGGHDYIALMLAESLKADDPDAAVNGISDNHTVLDALLEQWKSEIIDLNTGEKLSVDSAYKQFTANIGIETNEALNYVDEQSTLVIQADNKRKAVSAVSLDEEMKSMMIYQRSYNAAARMVNVIDSMIDRLVNGLKS